MIIEHTCSKLKKYPIKNQMFFLKLDSVVLLNQIVLHQVVLVLVELFEAVLSFPNKKQYEYIKIKLKFITQTAL